MKLADTIQVILEIEGQDIFYSNVFINMLDDFGAFADMPFAKMILKQMWDKNYHRQIANELHNESILRLTLDRIIGNLNANIGFDKRSIITTCNELLQGLNVTLSIRTDNSGSECIDAVASSETNAHLLFQGISMSNSIRSLSSLLASNNNYRIIEDKGDEIQMTGEFAGIQSSFISLDSGGEKYTKSITVGFYEEDETLRSLKGQLLMTKLNLDYGQPIEDPIFGLKWLSDGGYVYILPYQEVVAVIYMNEGTTTFGNSNDDLFNNKLSIESNNNIEDVEILNFLSLLKTEYNPLLSSANGLTLLNRKVSKYNDGVQWDIELGMENAKFIILKERDYDSVHSIRSILLLTQTCDNWHDLSNKYRFYQSCFNKLFGKASLSSETFDEYYEGPGDEINSLQEHSDGSFSSWYFNYAGVVLLEIRNAQVRIGYFHLPKDIDDLGKMKFMGISIASPKQEVINKLIVLGGVTDETDLIGLYRGYRSQYFLKEKFGRIKDVTIRLEVDSLVDQEDVYKSIRSNLINIYGEPDFETGPTQIGLGRYSKSKDWSSTFTTQGGRISVIFSKGAKFSKDAKFFLISFTDTILDKLTDYSEDFHLPVLLNMFE